MRSTTFLSLVLVSAVGVGCGGASSSGLFDEPSGAGDVGGGGNDGGHGGSTVDGAAGSPDAAGGVEDAGGGGTLDAGLDPDTGVVVDAGPPVIDAAPPGDPGVFCGDTNGKASYCKVGTACCVKSGSGIPGGGSGSSTCGTTTTAPFCTGVSVECDDDSDCGNGQTCCGTLVNNNRYTSVRCATVCDTQSDTQVHFCDLNAANDVCAADGMQCTASTLLPGYARCE